MQKKWKIIIGVIIAIVISGISIGIGLWKFADIDIVQQYKNKKIEANEKKENEEESIGTGSFQDGVKIISSRVNEELISINGKEDGISILKFNGEVPKEFDELEEEDIFVIEPNETLPEGFAGIFKSSEKDIVKVQTPELTEVFKDLEIDTKKSKELEVVGFTVNGKNMSTRGNSDNSLEEAIEDKTVQFHDDVKFDEKGTPYMDKLGITLKDFKPMDNDFVTLHGEISLEDLVFDLRLGIKDAILGEYGFNIYTDYTSNISMKIEANKKFEKDFEIVRLKLRTTGVSIALGEGIYKPRLGIEVVFMLGVNGEIYIEGEVAITNEGYVEIINKLDGFSFDSYSKIYGKNYPHKTVKSNESDIKDKKLKSELSLEVKGGMKTAINIPIKAAIYICKIEICSGTFRNGIEGTVESNGKVKVISGKKSKMEKGATIEANLDFVSGFELDGGGIKDLLETINIELESDLAIEKEILRINLLNFKYPDEIIDEEADIEEDVETDVEEDDDSPQTGTVSWGGITLDFSKLKELTRIYFDFNNDGTKDKVIGYVNKNLNGGPSTEAYIAVFDGKDDKIINLSDIDEGYYYSSHFIGSLDINGDDKEDIFASYYAGGNRGDSVRTCYFIYENDEYKLYTNYDYDTNGFGLNTQVLDNFKVRVSTLEGEYKEIEFDKEMKEKYIEIGLFTDEGKLLVEDQNIRIYEDAVAFEKNSKGGIDLIVKNRVQWVDTVVDGISPGSPSEVEASWADIIVYIKEKYTFNGKGFKLSNVDIIGANDKDNYNYYDYTDKTWSKGYIENLIMP